MALLWSFRTPSAASFTDLLEELPPFSHALIFPKMLAFAFFSASLAKKSYICSFSTPLRPYGTLNLRRISCRFGSLVDFSRKIKSSGPYRSSLNFTSLSTVSYSGLTETKTGTGFIYYLPSLVPLRMVIDFIIERSVKGQTSGHKVLPK